MRKALRIVLKTLAIIVAVIVAALGTTSIVNAAVSSSEEKDIKPYGQTVMVKGKKMNVSIQGTGTQTAVLLPGFGTGSPVLDFKPLTDKLSKSIRTVVIEPFGYGLSDPTDEPRTSANISEEVHAALASLGIKEYTLMGHSIAGIYALDYVNRFPGEVTGFVGIDSSVPTQPGMDQEIPVGSMQALKNLGLLRILTSIGGDPYAGTSFDEETKKQMKIISMRNTVSSTYADEAKLIPQNFSDAQKLNFPKDLPVLEFVQNDNTDVAGWVKLHEEQVASVTHGKLVLLDGEHYLHHKLSQEIADDTLEFITANAQRTK